MVDIFLSYASEDCERIRPLVSLFEQQGWSVWWDRKIPPGRTYDQVIEQALDEARCVVVVWSQTSAQSEWVKVEADDGVNRKILVPVLIDDARIPLAFRRIQAARLVDWQDESSHPELTMLFESIRAIIGEGKPKEESIGEEGQVPNTISESAFQQAPLQPAINEPPIPAFLRMPSPVSLLKHQRPKRNLKPWLATGGAVALIGLVIAAIWGAGSGGNFEVITTDERGNEINREKKSARYFTEKINDVKLDMVEISGGKFIMGSPPNEVKLGNDEDPQHEVTIQAFLMCRYEITQAQWRAVATLPKVGVEDLNPDPSKFKGNDLPVEQVSWDEAQEFCRRLSRATGRKYRLPTEAEWEYAARAGAYTPFAFGPTITPDIVNYDGSYPYGSALKGAYRQKTTPVGNLGVANAFGLFDMHGNVWEWCEDDWHGNYSGAPADGRAWIGGLAVGSDSVARGGGWNDLAIECRSANRNNFAHGFRRADLGFRLVRAYR